MGKRMAGGGTTSNGSQWEIPGWSGGNVSLLLLSSVSAVGSALQLPLPSAEGRVLVGRLGLTILGSIRTCG